MKSISINVAVLLAACALAAGCSGPAKRLETLDEYMAAYNARRKKANEGPNLVRTVEHVAPLMGKDGLSEEAYDGYCEFLKHVNVATDGINGLALAQVKPGEHKLSEVFRREVASTINEAALAELRKARKLPAGLIPLDPQKSLTDMRRFGAKVRWLARRLSHETVLHLSDGDFTAARERVIDMLTVERTLADSPSLLAQLVRCAVGPMANAKFLRVALSGAWQAKELDEMAAALEAAERRPVDVLRRALPLESAAAVATARQLESMSDKELARCVTAAHNAMDMFAGYMGLKKGEMPTVAEVRQQLAKEQKAVSTRIGAIKRALSEPGTRIPRHGPDSAASETPVLKALRLVVGLDEWARFQAGMTRLHARRRAAVALIRVLAFRKRNGRLPRAGELKLPEDPFRPGKRMTYVHDKKNGQIGVYAMMWKNAFGGNEEEQKAGYRLVLPQGEAGSR